MILCMGGYKEEVVQYKCIEVCARTPFEQRKTRCWLSEDVGVKEVIQEGHNWL